MKHHDPERECELIQRCIAGEEEAWEEFVEIYGPTIHNVVAYRLYRGGGARLNYPDVQNIFQEIFMGLAADKAKKLRKFSFKSSLSAWLSVVANRAAIDYLRREKMKGPASYEAFESDREGCFDNFVTAVYDEQLRQENLLSKINEAKAAIAELTVNEQMVLTGVYFEGLKHREIADILHLPPGSVSPTLTRALEKLRKKLKKD